MQVPSLVTTTFVGYVESKASLALKQVFRTSDNDMYICCNNLLYMRMSGFQRLFGGTLMSFTLLYSVVFHLMFESVHSCKMIRSVISVLGQTKHKSLPKCK